MRGVVIGPVLAAFLVAFVTGSALAGAVVFFVGLGLAAILILGNAGLLFRRRQ